MIASHAVVRLIRCGELGEIENDLFTVAGNGGRGIGSPGSEMVAQSDRQKLPARIWRPALAGVCDVRAVMQLHHHFILGVLWQRKGNLRREIIQNSCIVVSVAWQVDGKTGTGSHRNRGCAGIRSTESASIENREQAKLPRC